MAYRCNQAITGSATEPIRCKVSGMACAHQRMCQMEGRIVLTDGAMRGPARDGIMPEPVKAPAEAAKKPAKAAAKKPATRTRRKEK